MFAVLDTSFIEAVAADMVRVGSSVVRKDCATVLLCSRYRLKKKRKSVGGVDFVHLSTSKMNCLSESSRSDSSSHHSLLLMRGLGSWRGAAGRAGG